MSRDKAIALEMEKLRVMNPDFQSMCQRARHAGIPREEMLEIAVLFFAGKVEAYQKAIMDRVEKTGKNPLGEIEWPPPLFPDPEPE